MLFNKLSFLLLFALTLVACSKETSNQMVPKDQNKENGTPMVGSDRDAHGCIGSAGYQWSVLKNQCIRIFESGIRLDPKDPSLNQSVSAFVVFKPNDDDAQAEIFVPNQQTGILLDKVKKEDAGTWKSANYILTQWRGMYTLSNAQNKTLYQGAAVK